MMIQGLLRNQNAMMILSRLIVLLICLPVHECAHAWTADRLGDPTGRKKGRITLNPFKHLDYMGAISILLIGVGYAKPVPVNSKNFKHKKRDFALTALAGPVSNAAMAVLFLLIIRFALRGSSRTDAVRLIIQLASYAAYINLSLAVFNLIPIPPLDGSRIISALLPDRTYEKVMRSGRYTIGILLIAILCLNRMGVSPVGLLTGNVYRFLYSLIAAG